MLHDADLNVTGQIIDRSALFRLQVEPPPLRQWHLGQATDERGHLTDIGRT